MDWISVKDKLPAIDEEVIVFCGFQAFGTYEGKEDDGLWGKIITHWMPKFDDPNEYNVYRMRGKKCG
ncbi:MAG: DUF551 domain-containing protein [PVC group bacterium]|nr:DUF551 domain-containing protein [PVC group bacterium]